MKYYLYLDESGDHGLATISPDFPVFVLCGILIAEPDYEVIRQDLNRVKMEFWNNEDIIFHSRDIRKCEQDFKILLNRAIKQRFYERLNGLITTAEYTVISSAIDKNRYVHTYGRIEDDVYEVALSFIIERAVYFLDDIADSNKQLELIIEKRGKREDQKLSEHFQRLMSRGTGYVTPARLQTYNMACSFRRKNENINGLQLADLVAYPIARHVLNPYGPNSAFEQIKHKIYEKGGKQYGLKIFPKK